MEEWKGRAVVLRLGHFHESDIWLRLLCDGFGLFTVYAFGGARSIHRFCGCLDRFNIIECRIRSDRGGRYLNLMEAVLRQSPGKLRENGQRAGVVANCANFMEAVPIGPESSVDCFNLLDNLMSLLKLECEPPLLAALFFRLRLATILGFNPDFISCFGCGSDLGAGSIFLLSEGRGLCVNCAPGLKGMQRHMAVTLTWKSLEILRKIKRDLPTEWPRETLERDDRAICARIIDGFSQYHLDIDPKRGARAN